MKRPKHYILLFFIVFIGCSTLNKQGKKITNVMPMNRLDLIHSLSLAENDWNLDAADSQKAYYYANLLYQSGNFWRSWEVIKKFENNTNVSPSFILLAGKLSYMLGYYDISEYYFIKLLDNIEYHDIVLSNLLLVYYQQNRFDKIKELPFPSENRNALVSLVGAFIDNPYQIQWSNVEKTSVTKFITTDILPVFDIKVNGKTITVLFDTGADMLVLDPEIVKELQIENISAFTGQYGGGQTAESGYGIAEMVCLNSVNIRNVPITILPTRRISDLYKGQDLTINGIIGTGFLRQFFSTIDYKGGQIILQEKDAVNNFYQLNHENIIAEIPFVLDKTHFMLTSGSINNIAGLTFFVDSGLAMENCGITVPPETLHLIGVQEPEKNKVIDVGGGGGTWESGFFQINSIVMGTLIQKNMTGEYGAFNPVIYNSFGYYIDVLISHWFLRQYSSWSIDFNNFVYIFK